MGNRLLNTGRDERWILVCVVGNGSLLLFVCFIFFSFLPSSIQTQSGWSTFKLDKAYGTPTEKNIMVSMKKTAWMMVFLWKKWELIIRRNINKFPKRNKTNRVASGAHMPQCVICWQFLFLISSQSNIYCHWIQSTKRQKKMMCRNLFQYIPFYRNMPWLKLLN